MQEKKSAPLVFSEIVTALGVLAPGGSCVIRTFTLFEDSSVCALHLLGSLFKEVHVFKPATSKASNSELYVIAKGFKVSVPNPCCAGAACCAAVSLTCLQHHSLSSISVHDSASTKKFMLS